MLAKVPGPWPERGRGLGVLSDDFRRTVASSILKWVVRHHKCGSSGEAGDRGPGSKKGVWGPRLHRAGRTVQEGQRAVRPGWGPPSLQKRETGSGFPAWCRATVALGLRNPKKLLLLILIKQLSVRSALAQKVQGFPIGPQSPLRRQRPHRLVPLL